MGFFTNIFKLPSQTERKRRVSSVFCGINGNSDNKQNTNQIEQESTFSVTTTTTNSSSGKDFKYSEEGRSYHGNPDVKHVLPNDDDEMDRLHAQHWIVKHALQTNYHTTPITEMLKKGITVLDAGCGPATWTFEMARDFPKSNFKGVDISYVFPESIRPPNVELMIGNITQPLPFANNTIDYIHQRFLIAALTDKNWEDAFEELYRILKPGGYIEIVEADLQNYFPRGPYFDKLQAISNDMFHSFEFPKNICSQLQDRLIKAGFVNPVQKIVPLPVGHSGKVGDLLWEDLQHAYRNARPVLANYCPEWDDAQEFERDLVKCTAEAAEIRTSFNYYTLYAQKPLLK